MTSTGDPSGLNGKNSVRILFLGQCLNYGYDGVKRASTFPSLAATALSARFPSVKFKFDSKFLYHPTGLKTLLHHRLLFSKPDIVVISLPAMFAATTWRVNRIYEIAPELVDTARTFMRRIQAKVRGLDPAIAPAKTLLDAAFTTRPPLSLPEYERLVEIAVLHAQQISCCRIVLMGPGEFNEDTLEEYEFHSPELWHNVNRMIMNLASRLDVPFINAQEVLEEYGSEVFMDRNHRFSLYGHEVIAKEVAGVLAGQIAALTCSEV
ncbi:MAG TPA: hypothetical protein VKM94_21545 [Blastocatellia bacterium]|nr:hypothetical protein [Blastocatellia bacterium]